MNGGDGIILSKHGDICVGWELELPAAFRCNEEKYDTLVRTLSSAITLLPDYTIVHKQDIFMRKSYSAESTHGFLQEAYERHFDGREYLDHKCRLWLSFASKKTVRGGANGIKGISTSAGLPSAVSIGNALSAASQFGAVLEGCGLLSLRRLTEADIFGDEKSGLLQDYLNFTDEGADVLSDIALSPSLIRTGDKAVVCHLIADLDQLPGEVSSCRRIDALSTENSDVMLSFFNEIGQQLGCEHIVNWFCVKEPLKDIYGALDTRRRQMQSMSARNAGNRMYAEELNSFLEEAATKQMYTVRYHINVLSGATLQEIDGVKDQVVSAITKMGITPVYDIYDAPAQFWASIPGNEAGLAYGEYMTMELSSALCLGLYDGLDRGIDGGILKMSDRQRLTPQCFDIQEKAMEASLIENYNVFLLGPSGSGKSFFMNKYLKSCYDAGEQCFLIDQGDSYRATCHIIREESGGRDGSYYTFEKGKPISFNPFRNVQRFSEEDSEALDFLFTLIATLWKNNAEPISSTAMTFLKQSVLEFLTYWKETLRQAQGDNADPVFDDYYAFLDKVFRNTLKEAEIRPEHFDFEGYMIALGQFITGGAYGYLLNSRDNINILSDRFVVFEIDHIKGDKIVYPITTLVIMDAFSEKMRSNSDFKVMVIEEAWKAIMGTQMATYMMELWKTARKHRTSAVVVTQELKDIISSPIIKDTIVENSGVKILLDQTKYVNRFEELATQLSLSEEDKAMVLSLNRYTVLGQSGKIAGREVFFNLGNKKSFVMRLEVSPEELIAFSSAKKDKERLAKAVGKCGGSYIKAIKKMTEGKL